MIHSCQSLLLEKFIVATVSVQYLQLNVILFIYCQVFDCNIEFEL